MCKSSRMPGRRAWTASSLARHSTLLARDLMIMLFSGLVLLALTLVFWKELKLFSFDRDYASSLGFSPEAGHPAVRNDCHCHHRGAADGGRDFDERHAGGPGRRGQAVDQPAVPHGAAVLLLWRAFRRGGHADQLHHPQMPTGPAIVVAASVLVLVSLLIAPGGILARGRQQARNRKTLTEGGDKDVCVL